VRRLLVLLGLASGAAPAFITPREPQFGPPKVLDIQWKRLHRMPVMFVSYVSYKNARQAEDEVMTAATRLGRIAIALFAATNLCACAQNEPPPPGFSSKSAFSTCASHLTEAACKEGRGCRWINEHKREDGTLATARCSGGDGRQRRPRL
jgi:hypothetical protein